MNRQSLPDSVLRAQPTPVSSDSYAACVSEWQSKLSATSSLQPVSDKSSSVQSDPLIAQSCVQWKPPCLPWKPPNLLAKMYQKNNPEPSITVHTLSSNRPPAPPVKPVGLSEWLNRRERVESKNKEDNGDKGGQESDQEWEDYLNDDAEANDDDDDYDYDDGDDGEFFNSSTLRKLNRRNNVEVCPTHLNIYSFTFYLNMGPN